MELTDLIDLHRVEILEETEDEYNVRYGDKDYTIEKDAKNEWAAPATTKGLALTQHLEQRLVPESGIFQDEEVPAAFKEVMIFHEIREKWYVEEKGLETALAHELTLNDEVLYVLKFFDEKEARAYLKFVEKYREERRSAHEEKDDESEYANLVPVYALLRRIEKGKATPEQHQEFYFHVLTEHTQEYDKMKDIIEQTGQKPTPATLARICRQLLDSTVTDPNAAHILGRLNIIHREFDFSLPEQEIRTAYDTYNQSGSKNTGAFLELYNSTGIQPTLAQIRTQRAKTRHRYDEDIAWVKRERKRFGPATGLELEQEKSHYLTALDQLAAEIREQKERR